MGMIKRKRCRNCRTLFVPDARNRWHQEFCRRPDCRRASKVFSQKKWLNKSENRDYFKGPDHVARVQQWRKAHPGYWRRGQPVAAGALQDHLIAQPVDIKEENLHFANNALQDLLIGQDAVLIGLIANFTGSALQDDIATTIRRLQQLGSDILNPHKGGSDDCQASHCCAESSYGPGAVQLDRPPPGA